MNTMNWIKGVVVTVGLALGGSAMAAGPGPIARGDADFQTQGLYEHNRHIDNDAWDDGWLDDHHGKQRVDRRDYRLFKLGKKKIADGQALQARGEKMLARARWSRSSRMARQAQTLINRGESLEREGRMLVRRARA